MPETTENKGKFVAYYRVSTELARENAAKARAQAEALKTEVAELRKAGKATVRTTNLRRGRMRSRHTYSGGLGFCRPAGRTDGSEIHGGN